MSENPLLDTIIGINAVSLDNLDASLEAVLLIRLAALVAMDAPLRHTWPPSASPRAPCSSWKMPATC